MKEIFINIFCFNSPQDFISEHPLNGKVKIFTYLLGSEIDTEIIKDLSINNNGIYNRIRDTGDLRRVLLHFFEGTGRGHPTWAGPYIGTNGKVMISYVEPVYDNITDRLVAVVGTDVNIARIEARLEEIEQESFGYSFLVDNNGQTVFHSINNGKDLYDIALYETFGGAQEDDENYRNFMENVRHALITRVQGSARVSKRIDFLPVCVVDGVTDYYFRPIADTPFSIAVAFPRFSMGNVGFEVPKEGEWNKNVFMSDVFEVSKLEEFSVPRGIEIVNVSD